MSKKDFDGNAFTVDGKLTYFSIFKEIICNKIDLWKNLCCVIALFVFKNEKRGEKTCWHILTKYPCFCFTHFRRASTQILRTEAT